MAKMLTTTAKPEPPIPPAIKVGDMVKFKTPKPMLNAVATMLVLKVEKAAVVCFWFDKDGGGSEQKFPISMVEPDPPDMPKKPVPSSMPGIHTPTMGSGHNLGR